MTLQRWLRKQALPAIPAQTVRLIESLSLRLPLADVARDTPAPRARRSSRRGGLGSPSSVQRSPDVPTAGNFLDGGGGCGRRDQVGVQAPALQPAVASTLEQRQKVSRSPDRSIPLHDVIWSFVGVSAVVVLVVFAVSLHPSLP